MVASRARRTMLDRERAKAAQFYSVTARQGVRDFVENGVDDVFNVTQIKVRIAIGNALNEFGFNHRRMPL